MNKALRLHAACFIVLLGATRLQATPILGQIDTFDPPSTMGWSNGRGPDPRVLAGGPGGPSDFFLDITGTGGIGADSKITVFNRLQWAGDYLGTGIDEIGMDLKDLSPNEAPLTIRVAFKDGIGLFGSGVVSTVGFTLVADDQWHFVMFPVDALDMTVIGGGSFDSIMANVQEMRLLHSPTPALSGPPIAGELGVDNIQALSRTSSVPEPATFGLLGLGLIGAWRRRRHMAR